MDRAGRLVVPKSLRRLLQLDDGGRIELLERDGVIELRPAAAEVEIVETVEGPVARRAGAPEESDGSSLSDELVRETLERIRR